MPSHDMRLFHDHQRRHTSMHSSLLLITKPNKENIQPLRNAFSPEHQRRRISMRDLQNLLPTLQISLLRAHLRLWAARAVAAAMDLAALMVCLRS